MERRGGLLTTVTVIVFAFTAGFLAGEKVELTQSATHFMSNGAPDGVDLTPIWKAWALLEEKYVPATTTKSVTAQGNVWGMIEGLASSYGDPYTIFLPPNRSENFEEEISGEFGGIGVEIGFRNDILSVIAPLKGTPAEEAGLQSGDLILEVDSISTKNMTVDDAIEAIRGEEGSIVTLTIAREGENEFLNIPIVRGIIEIPTLDSELRDDGIFIISLYNFGGTATREIRDALREFKFSDSNKLILDLRGNPGGYLDAAVETASWFLPVGKTIVIEDHGEGKTKTVHRSKGHNIAEDDWKIVILIDGGSASASEIVAGALREHELAVLIGETTFGKGSVQELVDVTDDTSLKITVARWLTPNGNSLSHTGLTPDLSVERTQDDVEAERDPQLAAAVRYLMTGNLEYVAEGSALEESDEVEDGGEME